MTRLCSISKLYLWFSLLSAKGFFLSDLCTTGLSGADGGVEKKRHNKENLNASSQRDGPKGAERSDHCIQRDNSRGRGKQQGRHRMLESCENERVRGKIKSQSWGSCVNCQSARSSKTRILKRSHLWEQKKASEVTKTTWAEWSLLSLGSVINSVNVEGDLGGTSGHVSEINAWMRCR